MSWWGVSILSTVEVSQWSYMQFTSKAITHLNKLPGEKEMLQSVPNPALNGIMNGLPSIQPPDSSVRIPAAPIINILRPFTDDYFIYKGTVPVGKYQTPVMWLFSREPIAISLEQVAQFRTLNDRNFRGIVQNIRSLESVVPPVFYVNPKGSNYASLRPVPQDPMPVTASEKAHVEES